MKCRACGFYYPLASHVDSHGCQWFKCERCHSYTNRHVYNKEEYRLRYMYQLFEEEGKYPVDNHVHNIEAIERHCKRRGLLLDVGTGWGYSQIAAQKKGWVTLGFDVCAENRPKFTVVADKFNSDLFKMNFEAVLCREVLEHVDDGLDLLVNLQCATVKNGLCHITTPRPVEDPREIRVWQRHHLCIWAPEFLQKTLDELGWLTLENEQWEFGQRIVLKKHL